MRILPQSQSESLWVKVSVAHRCWGDSGLPVHRGVAHHFTITVRAH